MILKKAGLRPELRGTDFHVVSIRAFQAPALALTGFTKKGVTGSKTVSPRLHLW